MIDKVSVQAKRPQGASEVLSSVNLVTKSVHMSNQLDQMVRDYSSEKNIAQRDIFEIALVRFFLEFAMREK
ncbi:hypothetical protein KHA80_13110 [Anaerobacillus sp. HL2]|nr:hypothetical protein KHA80_13110 [Anaerobacillus sp. HL2]